MTRSVCVCARMAHTCGHQSVQSAEFELRYRNRNLCCLRYMSCEQLWVLYCEDQFQQKDVTLLAQYINLVLLELILIWSGEELVQLDWCCEHGAARMGSETCKKRLLITSNKIFWDFLDLFKAFSGLGHQYIFPRACLKSETRSGD